MAGKKKEEAEMNLEDSFGRLDLLLEELESPEISLEASFQKYQEGMTLLKQCNDTIDRVEKKVMEINAQGEPEESERLNEL